MMKVKTITGAEVEIGMEQMKKVYDEMASRMHHNAAVTPAEQPQHNFDHHFMIGGKQIALTEHEMKIIADAWWEKTGKHTMEGYFDHVMNTASENIRSALGHCTAPDCEKDIKGAIAQAVSCGDPGLIAEVIHEAAEWECGYFGMHSITADKES